MTTTTDQQPECEFMHADEVSAMTGLAVTTLRYWATQTDGEGPPSFRMGGRRVWRRSALLAWIAEQERASSNRRSTAS